MIIRHSVVGALNVFELTKDRRARYPVLSQKSSNSANIGAVIAYGLITLANIFKTILIAGLGRLLTTLIMLNT